MAVNIRGVSIPAIWANAAQTTIPNPPVVGIGYRNTGISNALIQGGQLYKSLGDSAAWNQYLYSVSSVAQSAEAYGIMPYCGTTTYKDCALCLYTDRLLYRAKSDVPTGTPCTNTTYWEKYIPDGVQEAPPITAAAGLTLYVDYTKSSSGTGLTLATAFRNLTDCFTAMRTVFAGANGAFKSDPWIPLFKVVISGAGTVNVEAGSWRIQNMSIEFQFNTNTSFPGSFQVEQSTVKFSGSATVTFNQGFSSWSSFVTTECNINIRGPNGLGFRDSNAMLQRGTIDVLTNSSGSPFAVSNSTIDVNTTVKLVGGSSSAYAVMRGMNLLVGDAGSIIIDSQNTNTGWMSDLTGCVVVCSGTLGLRMPWCIGSSFAMQASSRLRLGSAYVTADYGFILRGGYFYSDAGMTLTNLGRNPGTKGVAAPGSTFDTQGLTRDAWPGSGGWAIVGNGYYS